MGSLIIHTPLLTLSRTYRWFIEVDNIKIELQEVGLGNIDWIDMARYRDRWRVFVGEIMNLFVP
jgi:hypothetical protein